MFSTALCARMARTMSRIDAAAQERRAPRGGWCEPPLGKVDRLKGGFQRTIPVFNPFPRLIISEMIRVLRAFLTAPFHSVHTTTTMYQTH